MRTNSTLKNSLLTPAQQQGMVAYNAAGNQQKSMHASGQIPQSMKAAAAYGGGWSPAYDSVLKTTQDAWSKWKPLASEGDYLKAYDQWNGIREPPKTKTPSGLTKEKPKAGGSAGGQQGNAYSGQSTIQQPQYIDYNTTEAAAQNALALGMQQGDHRYQTKSLARPGFSQGKGQEFRGSLNAAENMNKAAAQAADIRGQDQLANNRMRSDYEKAREQEAQSQAMVQHALSQSDWARGFAKQSMDAQSQMAYLQSLLQLKLSLMR